MLRDLNAAGVVGLRVRVVDSVVLDDIAPAGVLERDAIAGHVVDQIVGDDIAVRALALQDHAADVLVDRPAVVDVIVGDGVAR